MSRLRRFRRGFAGERRVDNKMVVFRMLVAVTAPFAKRVRSTWANSVARAYRSSSVALSQTAATRPGLRRSRY